MAKNELTEMEKLLIDFMKILGFSLDDVIEVYEELSTEDEALEMILWLEPYIDQNKIPTREQVMSKAHESKFELSEEMQMPLKFIHASNFFLLCLMNRFLRKL